MSSDLAIEVKSLEKVYRIYDKPQDRFNQFFFGKYKNFYTEFSALKDVSFNVRKGQTIAIIGKNGSGKSTVLQIIAGTLNATSGECKVNGKVAALLELGSGFNPEFSGVDNVFLYGSILGISREEMNEKFSSIKDFADIGDFINQPVKTYSSGMYARLAFSVAIHVDPQILIVDEALSVGDVFFQQKCNIYMKEKMKEATKILVTHDMSTVAKMADYVIVLEKGRIVYEGNPLKAIEFYIKSLHNEVFQYNSEASTSFKINHSEWNSVSEKDLSGAMNARIKSYNFKVNNEQYKGYITKGDLLEVSFLFETNRKMGQMIYGYLVNDKYGNSVFGENTLSSEIVIYEVDIGLHEVKFAVVWPEIREGTYTVTLGIGEGDHEFNHVIQCWAHNIISLNNVNPNITIHGLFNNKIIEVAARRVK
ncbi:ABC transporter ATP-binding protein [Paenibacillus sabinae]|uniref:Polysaccharide/polyol phosphate ABC transporter ATPase n=1 Tax=Paenibacillus sabinae T27 TaxID=1268072 RepID=X4ZIH7_9BACL|nr:ABC transporter ATP-binding protein [Paenibacillus sabinae]AHV99276.1 polysaccharide/polyol phosphate ABC transporter ATPase [Paenibacillus sabinae T27]